MSDFPFLELQIISVNLISLFVSIWSWFKSAKKQLDKISKFSISDELDLKDIDWLKRVLSWIEVIRIVINLVLPLANIVNICTIVTRKWQNLLIFWMVFSLFKDIVLEVVVVVITFLQWHKGSFSTKLLIEFIVEKIMWLSFVSYKWWISLKWYMQLRREAKIRRFAKIANIINVPGRIGHSLDDECLEIATGRRDKYVSLLNLNRRLTERSSNRINFDLRISKSLTTSFTNDDSHDSNDDTNSSSTNDLNVAEKSMKILGLTAEDVMDACARIQERSYWNEQEVTAETPSGAMEEAEAQFFLEKDGEEISNPLKIDDLQREKNGKKDGKKAKDVLRSKQIINVEKDEEEMFDALEIDYHQREKDKKKDGKKVKDVLRSKQTIDVEKDEEEMRDALEIDDLQREKDGKKDGKKVKDVLRSKQTIDVEKDEEEMRDALEIDDLQREKDGKKDGKKAKDVLRSKQIIDVEKDKEEMRNALKIDNLQREKNGKKDGRKAKDVLRSKQIINVEKDEEEMFDALEIDYHQREKDKKKDGKKVKDVLRSKQTIDVEKDEEEMRDALEIDDLQREKDGKKDGKKAKDVLRSKQIIDVEKDEEEMFNGLKMDHFQREKDGKKDGKKAKDVLRSKQIIDVEKDEERKDDALEIDDRQREKDRKKDGKEANDVLRIKQRINVEKAVDCNLTNEIIMRNSQIKTEKEVYNVKIVSIGRKEQILISKKQGVSSTKSQDFTSEIINNRAKLIESPKFREDSSSRKKKRDEAKKLARIEQCPMSSAECKNARNIKVKPCASLVRKLEAKLRPTNQKEEWLDQVNQRKHSYQVKLTSTGLDASKKECSENSGTSSCACHRALKKDTDSSRNRKYARSTDTDDKNVKRDLGHRKEFKLLNFVSVKKDNTNGCDSAFKYSEAYRLKKQIQKFQGSSTKQTITWGSMSLAQTAQPSGYAKDDATKKPSGIYRRIIQIESYDESSESLNARYKSVRSGRSIDPRSIYNASFKERNYARSEKPETNTSEARTDLTFSNKKARRRHDLSPNRKLSNEEREAVELRALRAFNELTLLEDKKKLEAKKNRDSSLNEQLVMEPEVPEMKVFSSHNDLSLLEEQRKMGHNLSSSVENSSALKIYNNTSENTKVDYYPTLENTTELRVERKHENLSRHKVPEKYEEHVETLTSSSHLSEVDREETGILSELNYSRQAYRSLNLREITRNIEWTVHPQGIILTNKNLHRQFSEDEGSRGSRQRDIVDDNIASTLHSAFFFKPELVTRVFRRAQTRLGESLPNFPNFPTFRRENFNTEFVCQMSNETVVQWDSSSFNLDFERIPVRNNLVSSSFPRDNRVEDNRELCIIFIDQERVSNESETAIIENSTAGESQEDGLSSIETTDTSNIFLMCILRDFGVEVSEESDIMSSVERIEEYEDISNVAVNNVDFASSHFNTNPEEEDDDKRDTISLCQQISNLSDSCSNDVMSSVNLPEHDIPHNLPDKKYLDAIDISSEKGVYENNLSLKRVDSDTTSQLSDNNNNNNSFVNKSEKSIFNRIPENVSQLSFSDLPSLNKEDHFNRSIELKSSDKELQKLTQFSESEAMLENQRKESVINSEITNYDTISQSENVTILNLLETIALNDAKNDDRDIYEKTNLSSTHRIPKMNQDEWLRQDDSFYSMDERDNDSMKTVVSMGNGSLMEEFPNSTIPLGMSSNTSIRSSAHS